MKLLTIVIPSYNSEKWLAGCLDSLLIGLDDKLEVIIVNDGSKDKTSEIGHSYCDKYPFMQIVDKENGGHGSGINVGLSHATGLYFKVLDSDDQLDKEGLYELIEMIEKHQKENCLPDVYIADYISNYVESKTQHINSLKKYFKVHEIMDVENVKKFKLDDYMMLHCLFVKTELLKETKMNLLEKTFYEDNQYVYHTICHAKTYCHLEKPIYWYTLGREGQSIAPENLVKNYAHQLRVQNAVVRMLNYEEIYSRPKNQRKMIIHELGIIHSLTYFYIYLAPDKEKVTQYKAFWKSLKVDDKKLYKKLHNRSIYSVPLMIPGFARKLLIKILYGPIKRMKGW